ncbi:hypothetical protein BDU57DRAFT_333381 [Ampelomyces quisqualis]|uniref:AA1-like domain-containing protein n=1 Tax=Ampelomyces quisqualis TaxID=50730 RepID=A0A6A5QF52_AMPQU|nr:hypothetical protein BDU57DRAFT_333381 [Ampelomyces quisqualis]
MLTRLPIFASLATLAVADFKIYWVSPDDSVLGRLQTNVKMFNSQPDCASFPRGKQLDFNIQNDVSDSTGGGYLCDGCDTSQEPAQWIPTRIELNDRGHKAFNGQTFHISKL